MKLKQIELGISYRIETEVEASFEEAAALKLYDRFEHILDLRLTPSVEVTA